MPLKLVRFESALESKGLRWIHQPILCAILVAAIAFFSLWGIALKRGFPQPRVQDEFSYLLAADTVSHGRLTNPTPPFAAHFESPHVLVHPTYMSKYPPGQGAALAIGQLLTAQPIVGVWLSTAAAAVAIYWMLLSFVSRPWALLGGVMAALNLRLLDWGEVYWGGAVAVLGGAILLGAASRWRREPLASSGALMAAGLLILAFSRPFEGLMLALPIVGMATLKAASRQAFRQALPAAAVLLAGAALMGYFNFRVTRHILRMPAVEYARQFDVFPKFWFLPAREPPVYRDDVLKRVHTEWERGDYDRLRSFAGFVRISAARVGHLLLMNAQPIVLLLPLAAGAIWLDGWLWAVLGTFVLGMLAESWFLPHYAAPVVPLMMLMMILGLRRLGGGVALVCVVAFLVGVILHLSAAPPPARFGRADLIAATPSLQSGKNLILVRYGLGHLLDDEWVYNGANIESQQIIWARSLGGPADAKLLGYFHDRQAWLLEVGDKELRLNKYAAP
jgi:hypothetical protein